MADRGLSLRSHRAKPLSEMGTRWDYVITLCDEAFESADDLALRLRSWRSDRADSD